MATAEPLPTPTEPQGLLASQDVLTQQWRVLARAATAVAILTSPAAYVWLHTQQGIPVGWSITLTVLMVAAFRGFIDLILHRLIPWPSLFGTADDRMAKEDVVNRRRAWFWRFWYRIAWIVSIGITAVWLVNRLRGEGDSWFEVAAGAWDFASDLLGSGAWAQLAILPLFFLFNFLILMGPMMMMGISQIRGFEPGDADWGVRLDDVRGQAEAKEEVRKVVTLWQSGEAFERAGGKRERGLLFLGAPGTGKTMLAKAIATGFNCPIVTIPGSGFAQTFIGMDAIIVRWLARKAKKLAGKWGGQCIVFIDEIDAVGMRRQALAGGATASAYTPGSVHDVCFYGHNGALTASGDVILTSTAWAERLAAERELESRKPAFGARLGAIANMAVPGMFGGGGQLALNQLLVVMDGIDNPPFTKRVSTNKLNTFLDALYVVPQRIGPVRLRLPQARPTGNQIYFVGATNVPIESLDPALTRPGRMGRHVWFRTPTKPDRIDIFDLYLDKVSHDPDLDTPNSRDELARITNGYSPAMVEQVCSMALTYAHHTGRERFGREDILEAMTTIEAGTALGWEYQPDEAKSIAIHEAGHAVAAHVCRTGVESTRLSIKRRGFTGGHHQATEKEERFVQWRGQLLGDLIWGLGAMAAEHVFYGENTQGVGGDIAGASALASAMVGGWAMGPDQVRLNGNFEGTDDDRKAAEAKIAERFEEIGAQILRRGASSPLQPDAINSVVSDRVKRALVCQLLGQAYVTAYNVVIENREGVETIAEALLERREIYGDDLVELLNGQDLRMPDIDYAAEETWPKL